MVVHHLMMITGHSLNPKFNQRKAWEHNLDLPAVVVDLSILVREKDRTFAVVGECHEEEI